MEWWQWLITTVLTFIGGVAATKAVTTYLRLRRGNLELYRDQRAGTEAEWDRVSKRQQQEIHELRENDRSKEKQIAELHAENMKCFREHAESKAQLTVMKYQIEQLQKMSMNAVISTTATITADETGMIIEADDSVRDILGYRAIELKGENVDLVIPRRIRAKHHAGLEKARLSGAIRPAEIAISTFALTKDRREIPVIVALSSWRDETGKRMISAQIVHRRVFESVDPTQINPDGSDTHVALGSDPTKPKDGDTGRLKPV